MLHLMFAFRCFPILASKYSRICRLFHAKICPSSLSLRFGVLGAKHAFLLAFWKKSHSFKLLVVFGFRKVKQMYTEVLRRWESFVKGSTWMTMKKDEKGASAWVAFVRSQTLRLIHESFLGSFLGLFFKCRFQKRRFFGGKMQPNLLRNPSF